MKQVKLLAFCAALSVTSLAIASTPSVISPGELTWKDFPGYTGIQYTVLAGDPMKKEMFVARLKFAKDYEDVIHQHDKTRYDTVISGTYYMTVGDKIDKEKAIPLTPGSFIACAPNQKHGGYTKEETIMQISGMGPWEVLKSQGHKR